MRIRTRHAPWKVTLAGVTLVAMLGAACAGDDTGDGGDPADTEPADGDEEPTDEGQAAEPEYEWQMAAFLGESTAQGQAMEWWMDEVEERSNGRIAFERYYSESLLGGEEIRDGIGDGRVAVGNFTTAYTPADFPVEGVSQLPFVGDNVPAQTATLNDLYETHDGFREEFQSQGVHVLSFVGIQPPVTGADEPIESIDWFEGKSVRTSGFTTRAVEAMGGDAVSIVAGETYEAMQRGLIDAYSGMLIDVIPPLGLHEVGPHLVDLGIGYFASSTWGMSLNEYEALPDDLRQIIDEVSEEFHDKQFELREPIEAEACETILDAGGSITILDDSEVAALEEAVGDGPMEDWLAGAEAAGVDGEALYEEYVSSIEEYASSEYSDFEQPMARCLEVEEQRG
jgi:TRAP-type transport system periplasmic protein